jgi:hypothetical protein
LLQQIEFQGSPGIIRESRVKRSDLLYYMAASDDQERQSEISKGEWRDLRPEGWGTGSGVLSFGFLDRLPQ